MGALMTTTTVSDRSSGKGMMLMSGMMGKYGALMDLDKMKTDQEEADVEVELIDETKDIQGYTCKKAIIIDEEGNESTFWYTDEIGMPETDSQFFKKEIPGMPLEFSVNTPQMVMTMSASEIKTKVKKAKKVFELEIPEGYSEKSFEELQGMMNQGQ
jgi:GLPGLI family protein